MPPQPAAALAFHVTNVRRWGGLCGSLSAAVTAVPYHKVHSLTVRAALGRRRDMDSLTGSLSAGMEMHADPWAAFCENISLPGRGEFSSAWPHSLTLRRLVPSLSYPAAPRSVKWKRKHVTQLTRFLPSGAVTAARDRIPVSRRNSRERSYLLCFRATNCSARPPR